MWCRIEKEAPRAMLSAKTLLWIGGGITAAAGMMGIIGYFTPIGVGGLIAAILTLPGAVIAVWQGLRSADEGEQQLEQERAQRRMMSGRPDYEAIFEMMRPP